MAFLILVSCIEGCETYIEQAEFEKNQANGDDYCQIHGVQLVPVPDREVEQ